MSIPMFKSSSFKIVRKNCEILKVDILLKLVLEFRGLFKRCIVLSVTLPI